MIINIRGTSGSGKTTAVKTIMDLAPITEKIWQKGRRQPLAYRLRWPTYDITVSVPGHYETACGGADTIKTYDHLFEIIRSEHSAGHHVLFEGLLVAHDKKRCKELWEWLGKEPGTFTIIELTVPLETCLASVEARRAARKNPPKTPFNPDNTVRRYKEVVRSCEQLAEEGIKIRRLGRAATVYAIQELIGLPGGEDLKEYDLVPVRKGSMA